MNAEIFDNVDIDIKNRIKSIILTKQYVYVSHGANPNIIKIGITANPKEQASTLSQEFNEGQTLVGRTALYPHHVLRSIHHIFNSKSIVRETVAGRAYHGDWFDFTGDEEEKNKILTMVTHLDNMCITRKKNIYQVECIIGKYKEEPDDKKRKREI